MNRISKLILCSALMVAYATLNTHGIVYIQDAVLNPDNGYPEFDYTVTLSQTVTPYFSIGISALGNDEFLFSPIGIAELYSLYIVSDGVHFDPSYADGNTPFVSNWDTPPDSVSIGLSESLLFGYWDDVNRQTIEDRTPAVNDSYGWFEMQNTASGLLIVDGATAAGGGIISGTYTQIPEPSTIALLCLGVGAMIFRKRRKQE